MFVRLVLASLVLSAGVALAEPPQEPSFVLTIGDPVGGKPAQHKALTAALQAREAELRPALLAKTKAHHASRLSLELSLEVLADGSVKPVAGELRYRDARGEIKDDTIKPLATQAFAKTKRLSRELKGATVQVTVAILQP